MTPLELHAIRKQYELSQEDFGKALGVSRLTVYNWEKGKFALPDDIDERLLSANLAAPAAKKTASKIITSVTHPTCYRELATHRGAFVRTLNHPKWWCGSGSPFAALCSDNEWKAIDQRATVHDLATYITPTIEQAHALMVSRGITFEVASAHLVYMGYTLPQHLQVAVDPELVAQREHFSQPGATLPGFYEKYPQYKPKHAQATGEIDPILKQAFDTAFDLPQTAKG